MSGFMIPKTSHPNWANFLPEDEWKSDMLQKIRTTGSKSKRTVQSDEVPFEANFEANFDKMNEDMSSDQPSSSGS